jgi:hypothetical protein
MLGPGRQPQCPRAIHRVERVVDEVGPHLVELAGVGPIRLNPRLGAGPGQFRELATGEAVEEADRAKIAGAHHVWPDCS